jgi:crotonobetainyl-CoA:carnitine CoA-transferase CaiB-like acyl-CoA transferase
MKLTNGALDGIRVVDLSRVLGGPYCTQVLGDHGADVIKVEPPTGDETRTWGPPFVGDTAAYFLGVNRNKRTITLDLSTTSGRDVLLRLLDSADVLVENFKIGTMEKWELAYEALASRFPRLIYCRVTGFGADGPLGGLPGYDAAVQAIAGLMSVNGEPGGNPLRVGLPVVDMTTGLNAAIGILLALHARQRNGHGQFVEAALYDSGLSLLHPHAANNFVSHRDTPRTGNAHPNVAPYSLFQTGGAPIFLAVGNDGQFRKLCVFLNATNIAEDSRFASNALRVEHRDELQVLLEHVLTSRDGADLAPKLASAGVPCAPVLDVSAALAHPHTAHRDMIVNIGDYRGVGAPVKLSATPATYRSPPAGFGQHTKEILMEIEPDTVDN